MKCGKYFIVELYKCYVQVQKMKICRVVSFFLAFFLFPFQFLHKFNCTIVDRVYCNHYYIQQCLVILYKYIVSIIYFLELHILNIYIVSFGKYGFVLMVIFSILKCMLRYVNLNPNLFKVSQEFLFLVIISPFIYYLYVYLCPDILSVYMKKKR